MVHILELKGMLDNNMGKIILILFINSIQPHLNNLNHSPRAMSPKLLEYSVSCWMFL